MPGLGYAQVARMEVIPFQSMTLTDQERYAAYTREYLGWGVFALMQR
jgi:hypothetical protein